MAQPVSQPAVCSSGLSKKSRTTNVWHDSSCSGSYLVTAFRFPHNAATMHLIVIVFFTFMRPCAVTNSFIMKPTRCTNFQNLLWHETLHVSGSSSAHHQEFIHCTLGTGLYHKGLKTAFEQDNPGPAWKLFSNLYDIYQCQVYSE
jgi:hypothetical protein